MSYPKYTEDIQVILWKHNPCNNSSKNNMHVEKYVPYTIYNRHSESDIQQEIERLNKE